MKSMENQDQKPSKSLNQSGFTLVELSIVIIISGLLLVAAVAAYDQWLKDHRVRVTADRLEEIEKAIQVYVAQHGYLPCVAPMTATPDQAGYNRSPTGGCSSANPPSDPSFESGSTLVQKVRVGAIPTRSLNLADEIGTDGYGHRFTMAVTNALTIGAGNYSANSGKIDVVDHNGTSVIDPAGKAIYVILSHGPDGVGAYLPNGTKYEDCNSTFTHNELDKENCDYSNKTFRKVTSLFYSETRGSPKHFDDTVKFQTKGFLAVPAITSYTLDTMPCNTGSQINNHLMLWPNKFNEPICATAGFWAKGPTQDETLWIDAANGEKPKDGIRLYTKTITAGNTGRLIVRATIPIRYVNKSRNTSGTQDYRKRWEGAILASIYVNGVEIARGDVINPAVTVEGSGGGASTIIGSSFINQGSSYNVEIYIFTLENEEVEAPSGYNAGMPEPNPTLNKAWAGSIHLSDHSVDGNVEIMESGF